jgi:cytochrome c oxidase assembly factor CtaG
MRALGNPWTFAAGVLVVLGVLASPLTGAATELFSAHMMQHLLLIVVAAPLFVLSRAPLFRRIPFAAALTRPGTAWCIFVGVFLFWHWPAAFRWAAARETTRLFELGSMLLAACLFWSVALARQGMRKFSYGAAALFVMTAAVATDLPGVVMVFSPRAICTMPGENAALWGLSPLQDQQIAGLLMWVPANFVFFGFATWLFAKWIGADDGGKQSSLVPTSSKPAVP